MASWVTEVVFSSETTRRGKLKKLLHGRQLDALAVSCVKEKLNVTFKETLESYSFR